jgi:hypothetical protein
MLKLLSRVKSSASNRDNVPRGTTDGRSHIAGVPDELAIEVDADGSPITVHEADWFVCFVPGLQRQWWHRFADAKHKHVFAMRLVDDDTWLLVEPWWTRLMVSVLTLDEAIKFLRWGAAGNILKVREAIPGRGAPTGRGHPMGSIGDSSPMLTRSRSNCRDSWASISRRWRAEMPIRR